MSGRPTQVRSAKDLRVGSVLVLMTGDYTLDEVTPYQQQDGTRTIRVSSGTMVQTFDANDPVTIRVPATRPSTPPFDLPEGGKRITVQRCCNGCGRPLGDANDAEMDAAIAGASLPDVRSECGCAPAETTEDPSAAPHPAAEGRSAGPGTSPRPGPAEPGEAASATPEDPLDAFNRDNPVGSPVIAWPRTHDDPPQITVTRSVAWALGDGTPVVAVEGHSGGIALNHVVSLRWHDAGVAAKALTVFADATRFPNDWILFRRGDGHGVTVGVLLRETAARIRREAGLV